MKCIFVKCLIISNIICIFLFTACDSAITQKPEQASHSEETLKEPLEKVNRYLLKKENEEINNLVKRYNWNMETSKTGLRSMIYYKGTGEPVKRGRLVSLKHTVKLIDGTLVYDYRTDGLKQFIVGRGGVEAGLEEGILMLKVGDKAKFILPSHLGFGLLGDDDRIPPKATLVYDIEVVTMD